jgi:hypothetical protein
MYAHVISLFLGRLILRTQGYRIIPGLSGTLPIYYKVRLLLGGFVTLVTALIPVDSEQIRPHSGHKSRQMNPNPRNGQGVHVTITKTIDVGVEYHPGVLGGAVVSARTRDEESGSELSTGDQEICQELELQMRRDLEILY